LQEAITGVDAFLQSSDVQSLPHSTCNPAPHIDAAHESPSLISCADSLDISLSMMPEGLVVWTAVFAAFVNCAACSL